MGVVKRSVSQSTRQNQAEQQAAQVRETQQQEALASKEELKTRRACLHKQLRKTKFCMYHLQGMCMFGDNCAFAHNCSELQGTPDLRKTRLCKAFSAGQCKDPHCTFAHGEDELHSTDLFYKKTLCIWFEKGRCRNNDQCRFAHGVKDLRVRGGVVPARGNGFAEKNGGNGARRGEGAGTGGKSAGASMAPGRNAGPGSGGAVDDRPLGRAGGHQAMNGHVPAGDMLGDWAILGNHLGSGPKTNASGTANMLSARHLAVAAANAEGRLNMSAISGAEFNGAGLGGHVNGPGLGERPPAALAEPMFVQMAASGHGDSDHQQLLNKLVQVQQLHSLQQQLLLHQQLRKQWGGPASFGAPEAAMGSSSRGVSTHEQASTFEKQQQQLEQLQRASAATLAVVGAMGDKGSNLTNALQESDLEKLTQSVAQLTTQLSRLEKQMGSQQNSAAATPSTCAAWLGNHSRLAPEDLVTQLSPEEQATLLRAVNAAKSEASAYSNTNGRGPNIAPPWPQTLLSMSQSLGDGSGGIGRH
mmetsp:Transcript_20834/g.62069  ORF Transcript_20834/g.62069 Transcript_20834/m.62069 type:complete len:528 (+) Transcript_20834:92-1675(+)